MNIIGEYCVKYDIYTMFNTYTVEIKNHNLITKKGFEFFLNKWYSDECEDYPIILGYYHDNNFYAQYNVDDTFDKDLTDSDGNYDKTLNYIDKNTYNQYKYDGENFVDFNEKLDKICLGKCDYSYEYPLEPSEHDTELYKPYKELKISNFKKNSTELVLHYEIDRNDLNNTTEIGVKTNHGRLVSHDIHAPYNLPFGTNIILEYVFKLK